eukprot:UN17139
MHSSLGVFNVPASIPCIIIKLSNKPYQNLSGYLSRLYHTSYIALDYPVDHRTEEFDLWRSYHFLQPLEYI